MSVGEGGEEFAAFGHPVAAEEDFLRGKQLGEGVLLDNLGGDLFLDDEYTEGCRFIFELPL